ILMFITSFEEQNITYRSCSNLRIHLSRALKKNVFMYLNYAAKKDLTMFEGTGCVISDDIDFLIYRAIWNK
ncbi:hypothetical protein ACTJLR_01125, partial [Acinetobacter baumannii]